MADKELKVKLSFASDTTGLKKAESALGQVTATIESGRDSIDKWVKRGLAVYGVGEAFDFARDQAMDFINTASEFEQYENALSSFYQGQKALDGAMEMGKKFADDFNVSIEDTFQSITKMKIYGIDVTADSLEKYTNIAKGSMKSIDQFVEAMADAFMGENERLREFGVEASVAGNKVAYAWSDSTGKARSVVIDSNRKMIESTLLAIFNEKYVDQAQKWSTSWAGFVQEMRTDYQLFQANVMNAGLMDYIGIVTRTFYELWTERIGDTGESAETFSKLFINVINRSIKSVGYLIDAFRGVGLVIDAIEYAVLAMARTVMGAVNLVSDAMNAPLKAYNALGISGGWEPVELIGDIIDTSWTDAKMDEIKKGMGESWKTLSENSAVTFADTLVSGTTEAFEKLKEKGTPVAKDDGKVAAAKAELAKLLADHSGTLATNTGKAAGAAKEHAKALKDAEKAEQQLAKEAAKYAEDQADAYKEYLRITGKEDELFDINTEETLAKFEKLGYSVEQLDEIETALWENWAENSEAAIKHTDEQFKRMSDKMRYGLQTVFDGVFSGEDIFDSLEEGFRKFEQSNLDDFSDVLSGKITDAFQYGLENVDWSVIGSDGKMTDFGQSAVLGVTAIGSRLFAGNAADDAGPERAGKEFGSVAGTVIGAAMGGIIGASVGNMLGTAVGGIAGRAFGGSTSSYIQYDDAGLRAIQRTSGGQWRKDKYRLLVDETNQLAYDWEQTVKLYTDLYDHLGASNEVLDLAAGQYNAETLFDVYVPTEFFRDILGSDAAADEMYAVWSNYAKAIDSTVTDALVNTLNALDVTRTGVFEYINRDDFEAIYQSRADAYATAEKRLESVLGGVDITLDSYLQLFENAKRAGEISPEQLDAWNQLGILLVESDKNLQSYNEQMQANEQAVSDQADALAQQTAELEEQQRVFRDAMEDSARQYGNWRNLIGLDDTEKYQYNLQRAGEDIAAYMNELGVAGVTAENYLTMFRGMATIETVDTWEALGDKIRYVTDLQNDYADTLVSGVESAVGRVDSLISDADSYISSIESDRASALSAVQSEYESVLSRAEQVSSAYFSSLGMIAKDDLSGQVNMSSSRADFVSRTALNTYANTRTFNLGDSQKTLVTLYEKQMRTAESSLKAINELKTQLETLNKQIKDGTISTTNGAADRLLQRVVSSIEKLEDTTDRRLRA